MIKTVFSLNTKTQFDISSILNNKFLGSKNQIKGIAINLPQFHPIPENDKWWGEGFTEWRNVTKARPLFQGHYQPHLPGDLGFYDMRLQETLDAQAALAKRYGFHGFCYYHYWFNGTRLLNAPLDKILANKQPDFPFMLCWANENWTRRWDGQEQEILIKQDHSREDDISHIQFLIKNFFSDSRYITVAKKPVMLIYRPLLFPDIKETVELWRIEAMKAGLPGLYLGYVQNFEVKVSPESLGFDFAIEFQPDFSRLPSPEFPSTKERIENKLKIRSSVHYNNNLLSYPKFVDKILETDVSKKGIYKTVCPMWDNSARRQRGAYILHDSTPAVYQKWLEHAAAMTVELDNPENFLFVNAWNEWAEGNHLEPDLKFGRKYLEATKTVLDKYA